ncbi:MAG: MFS transporter [Dehalococcoidia bacterium]|nr:MFS transporter [Dehalococcoidia bacterium]
MRPAVYLLRAGIALGWTRATSMSERASSAVHSRVFYGYIVVGAALVMMTVSSGAMFSYSVFFAPLQQEFGWNRAVTSAAFSVNMVVQGLLSLGVGRLNDRFGPRVILTLSGVLLGAGFILVSRISTVWQLYFLFGVVIGAGVSGGPVPLMSTVARWFRARRGLMTGIVMAGVGFGTMFVPPFAEWLIGTLSWRSSFVAVGILLLAVIPLTAQWLRRDPWQLGLRPLGDVEASGSAGAGRSPDGVSVGEAKRKRQFWLLLAAFFGFGFAVHSVMVHVVVHATGLGLPSSQAAAIMTAIGALSVAGRVGVGSLADRYGSKRLLLSQFALLSLSLVGFSLLQRDWALFACAAVFGFGFGGVVPLNSHIVAELFGLRAHGAILGATGLGIGLGSATGPVFTGWCYDALGSYSVPFLVCSGFAVASGLLVSLIKPVTQTVGETVTKSAVPR